MDSDQATKISSHLVRIFGEKHQMIKAMEEMGELIQRLAKDVNYSERKDDTIEEIADVAVMLMQLSHVYGHDKVQHMIETKLTKLKVRFQI